VIDNLRKEDLSLSYLGAICAYKGIAVEPQRHDEDSIDVIIKKVMKRNNGCNYLAQICVQLKATSQTLAEDDKGFSFPLPIKNYRDLRIASTVPMMLCVLRLPNKEEAWVTHSINELIMRKCMYWCDLTKLSDSDNDTTVSVHISWENALTPEKADELMHKVAETGLL